VIYGVNGKIITTNDAAKSKAHALYLLTRRCPEQRIRKGFTAPRFRHPLLSLPQNGSQIHCHAERQESTEIGIKVLADKTDNS
jgi:hypothetical protein